MSCPVVVALAILLPDFWEKISIVYVAFVSNYALVLTLGGAEEAAKAKEASEK